MKFSFQCLAITHTSGRVTLFPVELPSLSVHAPTLDAARFELTLALDDRISRSHPRHLWKFCTPGEGELGVLGVPLLPVYRDKDTVKSELVLDALESAAQANHSEARLLANDLRFWFKSKGKELRAQTVALLTEQLAKVSPAELLALRSEGARELLVLEVEAKPLMLAALKKSELHLDERPPPKGIEEERAVKEDKAEKDLEAHGEDTEDEDDGWDDEKKKTPGPKEKKPKLVPTPTLNQLGVKWHQLAKEGAFPLTFGREAIVEQVRAHLTMKDPEPLVLIGVAGVGKTAILQEVARRLVASTPSGKPLTPFFQLDGSRLIAGDGFFGDWQRQTIDAFAEAHDAGALLHLGRLIDLLDAGKSAHSDDNVAQLLLPTLASRDVAVVAEATPEEWARVRDRNQSFARLFAPLNVEEPAPAETADVLARIAGAEGKRRDVAAEPSAVDEVRALVKRFRPYGSPLGNSVSFLRRLIDGVAEPIEKTVAAQKQKRKTVKLTREEVVRRFSLESGVPEELLRDDLELDPEEVRAFLAARVMGQKAAVARCAQVVSVIKSNLADPLRPVATLLFAGPTGVGKTELSKALAERVFGSRERMVRLDMGEYAGPDALARLVGEGNSEGFLATAVRRQPFSVVLLDEIEKAHPVVFDALLSVLGEGRLTDGRGRLADFRSCVLVMTSNLGASTQRPRVGFAQANADGDLRAHYLAEIRKFFRPELFNRLDDVVIFDSLQRDQLSKIVERELSKVAARNGFGRLDVGLKLPVEVKEKLADWGHEPRYGARPLKRALERRLVVPAAAHLASHKPAGASHLDVTLDGEDLQFALHSASRASDGLSRADLLAVCDEAAALRAEVRAWMRSPMMSSLRDNLRMFERLSRLPSYWEDRALADEQSRKATGTREIFEGLEKVRAQAEAAEELAFEAYGLRAAHSEEAIRSGLASAAEAFEPLTERLYASLFPPVDAATLTIVPGRNSEKWAMYLLQSYDEWARHRGLRAELSYLSAKSEQQLKQDADALKRMTQHTRISSDEVIRTLQQQGLIAAIKVYREKTGAGLKEAKEAVEKMRDTLEAPKVDSWVWERGMPQPHYRWHALGLHIYGAAVPMLLSSEHGSHRFHSEGQTASVKVRFSPGSLSARAMGQPEQLEVAMPNIEIRRIWPVRKGHEHGLLRDLRTETEHRADEHGFHLSKVLRAWIRFRVFGAEQEGGS
ncbi:MAG: AAA family ATPase [Archangium sp.]|nr:AAA family ATPase [Archangium sp.]